MGTKSQAVGTVNSQIIAQGKIVSLDQQLELIKPFSAKEIKDAIFSKGFSKIPGT